MLRLNELKVVGMIRSEGRYEVMIEEALQDDALIAQIYEKYDGPRADFGGGVTAINCGDLVDYYETPHKMARALKIKVVEARQIIADCEKAVRDQEAY